MRSEPHYYRRAYTMESAQKLGMEKVPVIVVEMNEAKRRAFAIADNKTAEIADWDFLKLREVLEVLRSGSTLLSVKKGN